MTGSLKRKRRIKAGLGICLTAVFYFLALTFHGELREGRGLTTVELTGACPGAEEVKKIGELEAAQEQPCDVTFWSFAGEAALEKEGLARQVMVSGISLAGEAEFLYPQANGLKAGDQEGCVIDGETAWELFGSREAAGQTLTYQGEEYVVRQVVDSQEPMFLYYSRDPALVYTMANFRTGETDSPSEMVNAFLMRYGLQGAVSDGSALYAFGWGALLLLPLAFVFSLGGLFLRMGQAASGSRGRRLLWSGAAVALGLLALVWLGKNLRISPDLIPTRWSDFSFWSRRFAEKTEGLLRFLQGAKSPGQMGQLVAFGKSCACSVAACLGYVGLLWPAHREAFGPDASDAPEAKPGERGIKSPGALPPGRR